jgi:outer membrane protein assembly factor BamB
VWFAWLSRENLSPALAYAYGRVYTVTEIGALYVLDALTGEKLSYYDQFGYSQMHSAPSLYNGNLYVGCHDWNVYCFGEARLMSGEPVPSASISSEQIIPEPIEAIETPFITTEVAIIAVIAVAAVIGLVSFWALRKRK